MATAESSSTVSESPSVLPSVTSKRMKGKTEATTFLSTPAGQLIHKYVMVGAGAVRGVPCSSVSEVTEEEEHQCAVLAALRYIHGTLLPFIEAMAENIPLEDMRNQRFGNRAFRVFWANLTSALDVQLPPLVELILQASPPSDEATAERDETGCGLNAGVSDGIRLDTKQLLRSELKGYACDSFGNATRLDFGTGHELHFFCFLVVVLHRCGVDAWTEERMEQQRRVLRVALILVLGRYISVMRCIQSRYLLEPAGSHGVWGLDDFHHLPFLFGAAQLEGREPEVLPAHITELAMVKRLREEYCYFAMIAWVLEHKHGPFHEHSSMLYNVSGLPLWQRITKGMIKMYVAEVLTKWNVIQHFLFGPTLQYAVVGTPVNEKRDAAAPPKLPEVGT